MLVKVFGRKPEKGAGIFFIPILAGRPPGAVRLIIDAAFSTRARRRDNNSVSIFAGCSGAAWGRVSTN